MGATLRIRELALMAGAYGALFTLRFFQAFDGTGHWEELHNATAAALLAGGYPLRDAVALQYMPFCGGCTVEALAVAPLFAVTGPALLVWKWVPLAFGLLILWLVTNLAQRAGGATVARVAGWLFVLSPPFYAQNRMIAWGNHFEVGLFILLLVVVWGRLWQGGLTRQAFLFGLLSGGAFWFCYTSFYAAPVLLLLWLAARPRSILSLQMALFLVGLLLGLVPWALTQMHFQQAGVTSGQPLASVYGHGFWHFASSAWAYPLRLSAALGPMYWASSHHPFLNWEDTRLVGLLPSLESSAAVLLAAIWGWREWRTNRDLAAAAPPWALALGSLALAHLVVFLVLAPLDGPDLPRALAAGQLRYLNPLVPIQALCMAWVGVRLLSWGRGWRRMAVAAVAFTLLLNGSAQLGTLHLDRFTRRPIYLTAVRNEALFRRARIPDLGEGPKALPARLRELVEEAPSEPSTRRLALFVLGQTVAHRLEDETWEGAFADALHGLDTTDRSDLLDGAGRELVDMEDWRSWSLAAGAPPRLASLTARLGAAAPELVRACLRQGAGVDGADRRILQEGGQLLADDDWVPAHGAWALGLAWHLGYLSALWTDPWVAPGQQLADTLHRRSRLHADLRRAYMGGVGEGMGERWGYHRQTRATMETALGPSARRAFAAGFDQGARRAFWWVAGRR